MAGNHYIILVHGTWGYEKGRSVEEPQRDPTEKPPWYAKGSKFRSRLRKELSAGSTAQREWRLRSFAWPECDNKDSDRAQAGHKLAKKIARIRIADPDSTIHFVAHSHGGNVVLEALSYWFGNINGAGEQAYRFAWDQAEKVHSKSIEAAKGKKALTEKAASTWPVQEDLCTVLKEVVEQANVSARNRKWPEWESKKHRRITDLHRAALLAISRTDLAAELSALSESRPNTSRWLGFIEKLRELGRTWDISVFDSNFREVERKFRWAENAAAFSAANQAVHGIGRLVFLGTPFFHKRWKVNQTMTADVIERSGRVFRVAVGLTIYVYILSLLFALLASPFVVEIRTWNPATWPWWVIAVGVLISSSVLPHLVRSTREKVYYDTNVYFDQGIAVLRRIGMAVTANGRIPSLVVSAGLLDEALLGLSAEPLVQGAFRPQLRRLLGLPHQAKSGKAGPAKIEPSAPPKRGVDRSIDTGNLIRFLTRGAFNLVFYLPRQVLSLLWRWAVAPVVERMTVKIVHNVSRMFTTGFGVGELRGASIQVTSRPNLDDILEEHFWDLTKHSLAVAPFKNIFREQKRFAFLLPEGKIPGSDDRSHALYRSLKEQGVKDHRLLETALVIDERVHEAVGAVGLVHSTYYDDETVTFKVAHFLRTAICASRLPSCTRCGETRVRYRSRVSAFRKSGRPVRVECGQPVDASKKLDAFREMDEHR